MTLLKKAVVEQAAAKVGIFGPQGSGKTTTAMLFLIGLSKTYHGGKPLAFFDTENGSDYLIPICEIEGVELMSVKSRAFKSMREALAEAEQAGCCGYLVDSYTHPWQELCDSFKAKSKRQKLEFHHMDELKRLWRGWTDQFLNSPLHVLLCGRLGYEWGKDEDGELVKLGSKMKSENEAGYEPSLLIEMEGVRASEAAKAKTRSAITHRAHVLKDRWRTLNGKTFEWKDINNYRAGDYKRVFEAFLPHWGKLAIGQAQHAMDTDRTSEEMFDGNGHTVQQQRATRVQIVTEEIQGALGGALWPGQDAKSKAMKLAAVSAIFGTRSWTAVEKMPLDRLEHGLQLVKHIEEAVKDGAAFDEPAQLDAYVKTLVDAAVV
jgi:hypothetical protein